MLYKSAGGVIASIFYLHWSLLYNRNQFALKFNSAPSKHSPRQSPSIQVAASCAKRDHCTGVRLIVLLKIEILLALKEQIELILLVAAKWIWWLTFKADFFNEGELWANMYVAYVITDKKTLMVRRKEEEIIRIKWMWCGNLDLHLSLANNEFAVYLSIAAWFS